MNLTIQIDETQFKEILDKELKDMPKEQLQQMIMQAFAQFLKNDPKYIDELFFTKTGGMYPRKEPTPLLAGIIKNMNFDEECDEIIQCLKDELKGNARDILEEVMLKAMSKVIFDKAQGQGWLGQVFAEMHYKSHVPNN